MTIFHECEKSENYFIAGDGEEGFFITDNYNDEVFIKSEYCPFCGEKLIEK